MLVVLCLSNLVASVKTFSDFHLLILALWGSAFAGQVQTLINQFTEGKSGLSAFFLRAFSKILEWTGVDDLRPFAATIPNFMKGIDSAPHLVRSITLAKSPLFKQYQRHQYGHLNKDQKKIYKRLLNRGLPKVC